jgi:hypothetical protein
MLERPDPAACRRHHVRRDPKRRRAAVVDQVRPVRFATDDHDGVTEMAR